MAATEEVLIRLTPSASRWLRTSRASWGWRPGLALLFRRDRSSWAITVADPEDASTLTFTSRGILLAVKTSDTGHFRGSVFSSHYEALFEQETWWLENPNDPGVSGCSDPLGASCCPARFARLHPELFGLRGLAGRLLGRLSLDDRGQLIARTSAFLRWGDGRAAVVLRKSPPVVATYCDEMDAVFLLRFPKYLTAQHDLEEGSRLVVANLHSRSKHGRIAADIHPGPGYTGRYTNVRPLVADFLAAEDHLVQARRRAIAEREYRRCAELGRLAVQAGQPLRSGRPLEAAIPGRR